MKWLTAKLLLPVSVTLLAFIAFVELLWLPSIVADTGARRIAEVGRTLDVVVESIKENPSGAQKLVDCLALIDGGIVEWRAISLQPVDITDDQLTLLRPQSFSKDATLLKKALEKQPFMLTAWVDISSLNDSISSQYRSLEWAVLAVIFITFFSVLLLQRWLLLKPVSALISAADELAKGDAYYPLPSLGRQSVLAPLFSAFISMREALTRQRNESESQIRQKRLAQERLNESHEIAKLGCWEWLFADKSFWCSDSLHNIMQLSVGDRVDVAGFFNKVHPADKNEALKKLNTLLELCISTEFDFRVSLPSGGYRHVHLISHITRDHKGQVSRVSGTCQDITDVKNIESSLQKLSSAITHSGSSVLITDVIGTIEYVNPKFSETTGFSLNEIKGQQPELLSRKWIKADRYEALWQSILAGQHWRGELQSRRKDGSSFWSLVSISPILNEYQELTHFVIVCEDVTELKDAHARMEKLALYDELTGLPNRRFFFRELALLFEEDIQEYPSVVMLLDLDYFKTVNDTQGHGVGDQLLIQVAQRLVETLHDDDIAARLGGDEFAVLIHPVKDVDHVEAVAKRILSEVSRPFHINEFEIQISTSLGMAWLPKDGQTPEALLKHADLAMYQAKEMGRNQFRFFTESLHDQLQAYIRFSREMPKGLEAKNFILHYQPQVDLKTGKIISAEALVRWEHPELGLIPPLEFISIAEETGFIVALGRWIVETACETVSELKSQGFGDIRIAINLSSRQFRDPDLLKMIREIIAKYQINPKCLELEITETLLMQDIQLAIEILKSLQALGVTIAIDDFGVGYSSFNYLKTLPINVLKVDREFIKDIPDHLDDMEITAAIISMAHRLNMRVVAEGIETQVQQVFLEEHHCDIGQGYLFSRPVPREQFLQLLKDKRAGT